MRYLYRLSAYLWMQFRFNLTFFRVRYTLAYQDVWKCFMQMIIGTASGVHPAIKAWTIGFYQQEFGARIFIESGTNQGDTLAAVAHLFRWCYTIEINLTFWETASKRMEKRNNVVCLLGSSADALPNIIDKMHREWSDEIPLFWIDAHFAFEDARASPLRAELAALEAFVRSGRRAVILIDDARMLCDVSEFAVAIEPLGYTGEMFNDIWRFTPNFVRRHE